MIRRTTSAAAYRSADAAVGGSVTLVLDSSGAGTRLTFEQSGFPDGQREHLDGGWSKMYWEPLRKYLS